MKDYLVIGAGRFGQSLSLSLMDLGNEVVVIDQDEQTINKISPYVTHAICADIQQIEIFEELGLGNIDTAIVAMGSNLEASVLATITLKELGVSQIICKAKTKTHSKVLKKVGADQVVIPEFDMGKKLAYNLSTQNVVEYFNIVEDYSIFEILAPQKWWNKALVDLDIRNKYGINIIGIIRENDQFIGNPGPETMIEETDKLVIMGSSEDFRKIEKLLNKK
ncbi:potassium channel family protein [Facklamia lactis]|uniref:potassium channel family protein n=1 Tax=Facklamia lactis TaxID=2749967 RepID=UPI0018CFC071|nr:TrkA family potassium uptake protein [Facklamia lactis]MBG9981090.1 TrkA family potassium uptake protein [Facklamia lactis]